MVQELGNGVNTVLLFIQHRREGMAGRIAAEPSRDLKLMSYPVNIVIYPFIAVLIPPSYFLAGQPGFQDGENVISLVQCFRAVLL